MMDAIRSRKVRNRERVNSGRDRWDAFNAPEKQGICQIAGQVLLRERCPLSTLTGAKCPLARNGRE